VNIFIHSKQVKLFEILYLSTGVKPPSDCINKTLSSLSLSFSNAFENVSIYRFKHGVK
jgi:hypothetical protein